MQIIHQRGGKQSAKSKTDLNGDKREAEAEKQGTKEIAMAAAPPSTSNPNPNSSPINLSNQKPNLNGLNQAPSSTNSASRVFPSPPPSSPIPPPPKAATAQQLLPRIQESLAAHGTVCPSLSSSSRVVRSSAEQVVTVVSPTFFNGNPAVVGVHQVHGFSPFMVAAPTPVADPTVRALRSPPHQRPVVPVRTVPKHAGVAGPPRIGAPAVQNKVTPFSAVPSPSDLNNYKEMREKNGENAVTVVINDRKVRLFDGAPSSLYALCRSWVRNDMPPEIQPQFGEGLKLLPRPLPINTGSSAIPKKVEGDADEDDEFSSQNQAKNSVDNLSARELLETHVRHAKKVRARLREERLQRIDRFKQRLALLLPPSLEQNKNDVVGGI